MDEELTIDQIDLDDDDVVESGNEGLTEQEEQHDDDPVIEAPSEPQNINDQQDGNSKDVLDLFLQTKGIADANAIKFQDEDGNLYSKPWDELTAEEQYNILNSTTEEAEQTALDEYEIGLINELRRAGVTPNEFIEAIRKNSVDEYIASQQQDDHQEYNIDELTDDEIYTLDLQSRIENITDQEIADAIEIAKANPELYAKQIAGIRNEYQALVENNRNRIAQEQAALQEQQQQRYAEAIVDSIGELNNMGLPIELDYNDLEQIADHILEKDVTGTTAFSRAFNDPKSVAKMAFYNMYGDAIINDIVTYFQDEISRVSQAQYDRGFNAGQSNKATQAPARLIHKPASTQPIMTKYKQSEYTIDDLDN